MRSQKDPFFSDLCDRVARGNLTVDDENYLKSRVQPNPSENSNEKFKEGKILIIVTTNPMKDLINLQKLAKLIPEQQEYSCNSIDRITNLPAGIELPEKLNENPGKTGNLESDLKVKVGAPVVITSNHAKQKYREDGIMNGARGFVQAIQVSKENPQKVEVIWVIFNNKNIGKLYRFEHNHLRQNFDPGHKLATPIMPSRKNFKLKFGNVEYQRQNFALSLAYSVTAHKCQGETLDEVIIDFGNDEEHKIKNYICSGSFYVALTRVREGRSVYLRSFDKSYIKANNKIEEKVNAMIKHRSYECKKIYLDHKIFNIEDHEIKIGYLNINGLLDGNHGQYFNDDRNLRNLDVIVIAETKLGQGFGDTNLETLLNNWKIIARYDAGDQKKHMGLLLLTSKQSKFNCTLSITYQTAKRDAKVQIEGIVVRGITNLILGFLYCRSTPTNPEIKAINKYFKECNVILGDLNLSHRIPTDKAKVKDLCQDSKVSVLNEITRSISNNQLDYILMDKSLTSRSFVTSYHNFISDHKTITARIGMEGNTLTDEMKMKITFDKESHLKTKQNEEKEDGSSSSASGSELERSTGSQSIKSVITVRSRYENFRRKFFNSDYATCWLNSCLQLFLTAIDHFDSPCSFDSELGTELMFLRDSNQEGSLDPTTVKTIIVAAEDTRIALRLSELEAELQNEAELEHQANVVRSLRYNLLHGQQCIRDLFLCLQENAASWPDVCSCFYFTVKHSTVCAGCDQESHHETNQMYVEMEVPPDNSNLSEYLEDYFGTSTLDARFCSDGCKTLSQAEKRSAIKNVRQTEFFIVVLTRAIESLDGYELNENQTISTTDVYIR